MDSRNKYFPAQYNQGFIKTVGVHPKGFYRLRPSSARSALSALSTWKGDNPCGPPHVKPYLPIHLLHKIIPRFPLIPSLSHNATVVALATPSSFLSVDECAVGATTGVRSLLLQTLEVGRHYFPTTSIIVATSGVQQSCLEGAVL
jgi:hypothetical protein